MIDTVQAAYEALKPPVVVEARTSVTRQGDIFAIETPLTRRDLRDMGATISKRGTKLLETNHTATEVAVMGDQVFARGVLYHEPDFRTPDHARRKMGDGKAWHEIYRNTVPRSIYAPRAWTISGGVD